MTNYRQARLNGLLREELTLILNGDLEDPRLALVSVSDVEISADLRHVRVYVSVLDDDPDSERAALKALDHANGFLRRKLAQTVNLRYTPELSFKLDRTEARAERVDRLLREIAASEATTPPEKPDAESEVLPE